MCFILSSCSDASLPEAGSYGDLKCEGVSLLSHLPWPIFPGHPVTLPAARPVLQFGRGPAERVSALFNICPSWWSQYCDPHILA